MRRGLLYAGTETGVYYSTDDGAHWEPLQLNLPRASVRDLKVQGSDLIAATHGRAMWVLDDVSPLRTLADSVRRAAIHLFTPDTAIRFSGGHFLTTSAGENPPSGVDRRLLARRRDRPARQPSPRVRRRHRQGDSPFLERVAARLGQVRRVRAHVRRLGARAGHESRQTARRHDVAQVPRLARAATTRSRSLRAIPS